MFGARSLNFVRMPRNRRHQLTTTTAVPSFGRMLDESEATAFIRTAGIPIGDRGLQDLRSRGGGPGYHRSGRTPLYAENDLRAWIAVRLGVTRFSTAEEQAMRRAKEG